MDPNVQDKLLCQSTLGSTSVSRSIGAPKTPCLIYEPTTPPKYGSIPTDSPCSIQEDFSNSCRKSEKKCERWRQGVTASENGLSTWRISSVLNWRLYFLALNRDVEIAKVRQGLAPRHWGFPEMSELYLGADICKRFHSVSNGRKWMSDQYHDTKIIKIAFITLVSNSFQKWPKMEFWVEISISC